MNSDNRIIFLILLLIPALYAQGQTKKEIKSNKIKSTTEYITETINGKEVTYKSQYLAFDRSGNTLEKTEYLPDGSVRKKNTVKFDSKGNRVEETDFLIKDDKGKDDPVKAVPRNVKIVSKFNSGDDKTEEIIYDGASGRQLKKLQMSYNSNGGKTLEVEFDSDNKLVKKMVYTYDKKGLRIERKTYDASNKLVEEKKYVYQF